MSLYNSALLADAAYIDFSQAEVCMIWQQALSIMTAQLLDFSSREASPRTSSIIFKVPDCGPPAQHSYRPVLTILKTKPHELTIAFRGPSRQKRYAQFLQDLFRDLVLVVDFDVLTGGIGADGEIVKYGFAFGSHKAQEFALSKTSMLLCDFCRQSAHFLH